MGLRTHRWGPTAITCRGASHGPGVPLPTAAKFQTHHTYRAIPAAMTTTASHMTGVGVRPLRVRIHQGTQKPPRPGTTTVNSRLRMTRLSVRVMVAQLPEVSSGRATRCRRLLSPAARPHPALYIALLPIATLLVKLAGRKPLM